MSKAYVTGASQRVTKNAANEWCAWYECHKCGDEFARSSEFCRNEADARRESAINFNIQEHRFCWRCGYKQSTSEPAPEHAYIAELNARIDKLQRERSADWERRSADWERIKTLQDAFNGLSDAERFALHKGWIRAVPYDEIEQQEGDADETDHRPND